MIGSPLDRRTIIRLLWAGIAVRGLVALLTPVPGRDAANYLWMAQQFAAGEFAAALSEVFPPAWPLVAAPFVATGIDAFRVAQVAAVLVGAASVVAMAHGVAAVAPRWAAAAGWMLVAAPLPARLAGECMSEPLFHLLAALAIGSGLRERWWWTGVWAGLAFCARPEGALIGVAFAVARPRVAWRAVLPIAGFVLALGAWRAACGLGFDPVPTLAFDLARGDAAATAGGFSVGRFFAHVLAIPWLWVEAFQAFGLLALIGLLRASNPRLLALRILLLLAIVVICAFLPRRRFLVSWIVALAPFAALALKRLPPSSRWPIVLVVFGTSLLAAVRLPEGDRYGERVVGEYLGAKLEAGDRITGDQTRVVWFAGQRPFPPRHFSADDLASTAREPGVRFVVLASGRPRTDAVVQELGDEFGAYVFPEVQRRWAAERGLTVLERR